MFGAAFSALSGGRGGATGGNGFAADWSGGFSGIGKQMREYRDNETQLDTDARYEQSNAAAGGERVSQSFATNPEPNIPMSGSYNAAASAPVFPPAAQNQAAAVFGSNDERQGSTSGFKQEVKERIMTDLNSL